MFKKEFVSNYLSKAQFSNGVVVSLLVFAICCFLSNMAWLEWGPFHDQLVARPDLVFVDKEYWRLITTIFVHGDLKHLLSNSLLLLIMGYYVYSHFGSWVYPTVSLLAGAVVNFLVLMTFKGEVALVGISGVVYFLWGFWLTLFLKIQTQIPLMRRLMKVFIVGSFLLIPEAFEPNVSHLSHFLGFVLGVLIGIFYYLFNQVRIKKSESWRLVLEDEELYSLQGPYQ